MNPSTATLLLAGWGLLAVGFFADMIFCNMRGSWPKLLGVAGMASIAAAFVMALMDHLGGGPT